ncbi:NAD-dependent epimerase/dehydratase family protein [Providencia stuartii]|uniref:NAD-dependent epimerase/dehydratase family protein n=1 Tax=Providencia stuartii TaxID=588 RepID=UPI0024AC3720|nr:NAD(P)-dependent oxidoreductase [Providencia stuartii]MCX3071630.1 NAD(P)-dependent oxidoreductase [Providencia stuartii]
MSINNKKVLVIGASGSLGQGLCNEISSKYSVTGTYLNNKKVSDKVKYTHLDITKEIDFNTLDTDYDSVVLIAGAMPATMEGYNPNKYFDVNVYGTINVLEFCRKNNIRKFIYIMTFSDRYNNFYNGVPIQADDVATLNYTGDHAIYSISKVTACEVIEHYHQEYGLQTIIFRIPTVYCYDDKVDYYVDGKIKTKAYIKMIRDIIHKNEVEIWGDKNNAKDMPYIKDFARLISLAIDNSKAQGVYNAGTGKPISLEELVNAMIKVFSIDGKTKIIHIKDNTSQPNFTFDMTKTIADFSFHPEYNIEMMLEDIKKNLPKELLYGNY